MTQSARRALLLAPLVGLALVSLATPARADDDEQEHREEGPMGVPPASTGFQLALRTGVGVPLGDAAKDAAMSDAFGVQFPLTVDIGGKIIPELFLGAYLGFAIGGAAGKLGDSCDRSGLSCTATSVRVGAELQYHIAPEARTNPWIGYGFGYERSGVSGSKGGDSATTSLSGLEFAHFMAGLDFRLSKTFGLGPVLDFSVGQYSSVTNDSSVGGRSTSKDSDIDEKAVHSWLTLGMRFVFFP